MAEMQIESVGTPSSTDTSQLTPITRQQFRAVLKDYLTTNHDRVVQAYMSGGWELWLHVELYLALKKQYPSGDVRRESRNYKLTSLRSDLVLNETVMTSTTTSAEAQP